MWWSPRSGSEERAFSAISRLNALFAEDGKRDLVIGVGSLFPDKFLQRTYLWLEEYDRVYWSRLSWDMSLRRRLALFLWPWGLRHFPVPPGYFFDWQFRHFFHPRSPEGDLPIIPLV